MGKKKFTQGLESLFGNTSEEGFGGAGFLLVEKPKKPSAKAGRKSASRKNFTTDLDSLLEDALKDSTIGQNQKTIKESKNKTKFAPPKTRPKKSLAGLDALIRPTAEPSTFEIDPDAKKRVSFVFDKYKFEKLKKIARIEKSFLKDILGKIISDYIETYERQKGNRN